MVIINYLEPLEQFICDECGEIIEKPEEGTVEWLSEYKEKSDKNIREVHKFRIVHNKDSSPKGKGTCFYFDLYGEEYRKPRKSLPLKYFIKDEGVARMLGLLREHANKTVDFKTKEEYLKFIEIMRRISIPYYEESKLFLERYYREYTGEPNISYKRLNGKELKKFLDWIDGKDYNYNL